MKNEILEIENITIQKIILEIRSEKLKREYVHKDYTYGVDDVLILLLSMK